MAGETGPMPRWDARLFPNIFRSFRMAIQPSKLALAFLALAAICLTGRLMDLNRTVITAGGPPALAYGRFMGAESNGETTELDLYVMSESTLRNLLKSPPTDAGRVGVFTTLWNFGAVQFHNAVSAVFTLNVPEFIGSVARCLRAVVWAFKYHTICSLLFFTVALVALSPAGGAICRIAALQFARNERIGLVQAARFARQRLRSLIGAPIGPYAIALGLGVPVILLGLIGNIPYAGELITGILLPLALVLAPFIAVILIGAVAGLNLMFPAIAYEDSDFFDAISRSVSSVYAKPWRMGFYTLAAFLYGAVCYVFVRFFVFLLLWVTHGLLRLGLSDAKLHAIWPEPGFTDLIGPITVTPNDWSLWIAAQLIRVWLLVVVGLMISFLISFYFSANTVIYALMRNRVDGTPLDEIYGDVEPATGESPPPDAAPQTPGTIDPPQEPLTERT